jgi:hypothetical protein
MASQVTAAWQNSALRPDPGIIAWYPCTAGRAVRTGAICAYNASVNDPQPPVPPATFPPQKLAEIEAALRLFDETTTALSSRINRLEEVLVQKQQALVDANTKLRRTSVNATAPPRGST